MKEKSQMEIEYEKYLSSNVKTMEIDGVVYFKIIQKQQIPLRGGTVLICLPWEFFEDRSINDCNDENGRRIKLGAPVHYSFREQIPEWYLKTVTVNVEDIHGVDEIGDYLSLK